MTHSAISLRGDIPQSFGYVKRPHLLAGLANAVFELVSRQGLPLAGNLTGQKLIRFRPRGKFDATIRHQGSTPVSKPSQVLDRFYPVLPEFLDFNISDVAREVLRISTGRYFGVMCEPTDSVEWPGAEELLRLKESLDPETESVSENFVSLTAVLGFRYRLKLNPLAVDLRVDSQAAKAFFRDLAGAEVVRRALAMLELSGVEDGLVLPDSYDLPTAITMGILAAAPGVKAILYTSSPAFIKCMKRDNLVLFDAPGVLLAELEPLDVLSIQSENGATRVQAEPVTAADLDRVRPMGVGR